MEKKGGKKIKVLLMIRDRIKSEVEGVSRCSVLFLYQRKAAQEQKLIRKQTNANYCSSLERQRSPQNKFTDYIILSTFTDEKRVSR